jgi:hypothetical protein
MTLSGRMPQAAPGFHASHRARFAVDGPSGFNPISQGEDK